VTGTVEIAGGGIAGLTTGLAFARKGWRVRVHEQDDGLRILGAGIYLFENGLRVLDALGVLDAVIAGAIPASRHEKRNHDGSVFAQSRLSPDFRLYVPLRERRRAVNQFGYRAMNRREPGELTSDIGRAHCENWNGSRRLLYAPCTEEFAYVQLTSLKDDAAANRVPIDRDLWGEAFPRLGWVIDRLPDDGRGDWFELIRVRNWAKGASCWSAMRRAASRHFSGRAVAAR
jgi:FAD binding domain